jgi:hypothetical protein
LCFDPALKRRAKIKRSYGTKISTLCVFCSWLRCWVVSFLFSYRQEEEAAMGHAAKVERRLSKALFLLSLWRNNCRAIAKTERCGIRVLQDVGGALFSETAKTGAPHPLSSFGFLE